MTKLTSFQEDIRPLSAERDIQGMMTSKRRRPLSTTAFAE